MKRVEDNKEKESGPILANSQSNSHVLDQQYSQFWQKKCQWKAIMEYSTLMKHANLLWNACIGHPCSLIKD